MYSCASGLVTHVYDAGPGWGLVVRVAHFTQNRNEYVESLYAHLDYTLVTKGAWIKTGTHLRTIGNADGLYWAHLHFELRSKLLMPLGPGYSGIREG